MTEPRSTGGRLPLLDGMRGLAAAGVLLYHWPAYFAVPDLLPHGYLLVDLFFLLSGFVLTPVVARQRAAGTSAHGFLAARIRRFWPVAATGTFIGAVVLSTNPDLELIWLKLALGLAFVPSIHAYGLLFPLNGVQWSLFWELVANYLHAKWFDSATDRLLLAVAAIFGALLCGAIAWKGHGNLGAQNFDWYLGIPRFVYSYVVGMLLARGFAGTHAVRPYGWGLRLAVPVAAVALIPLFGGLSWLAEVLVVLGLFPLAFRWLAGAAPSPRYAPFLSYLGKLSFPLYAVHLPLFIGAQLFSFGAGAGLAAVAVSLALSAWIARFLEPGRRKAAHTGLRVAAKST